MQEVLDENAEFKTIKSNSSNGYINIDGIEIKVYEHPGTGTNPHGTTKNDIGLGDVLNYGIAAQEEAEAGTSNEKYMTPLRTAQAFIKFSENGGGNGGGNGGNEDTAISINVTSGTVTCDLSIANVFIVNVTESINEITLLNIPASLYSNCRIYFRQDAVGSHHINVSGFHWENDMLPLLVQDANSLTAIELDLLDNGATRLAYLGTTGAPVGPMIQLLNSRSAIPDNGLTEAFIIDGTLTLDLDVATRFMVNVSADVNVIDVINAPNNLYSSFKVYLKQDATGAHVVNLSGFRWENGLTPVMVTTASTYTTIQADIFNNGTAMVAYIGTTGA